MTDGGDFRVRATRATANGATSRNITTLKWQPIGQQYRCRVLAVPTELQSGENKIDGLRIITDPLPNEFKFDVGQTINEKSFLLSLARLISIIEYSIAQYRL